MRNDTILVTGGTGTLGRLVVARLRAAGRDVRVLSRHGGDPADGVEHVTADLREDDGIEPAVAGTGTILHLAGGPKGDDEATRNLMRAASGAGTPHLVYISVIGADRVPLGYMRSKHGAEQAIVDSGVPFTILRAAQFHDLVLDLAGKLAKLPVLPLPSAIRFQPVDADEVAAHLVQLALGEPAGRVRDLAGPEIRPLADLVRAYLRARGKHRPIVPVPLAGKAGRAYKTGDNLAHDATAAGRTWEAFLAARLGTPAAARAMLAGT